MALLPGPAGRQMWAEGVWREGECSLLPPFPWGGGNLGPINKWLQHGGARSPAFLLRLPRAGWRRPRRWAWLMGQGVLPISSPISRAVGLMTPGGHNPWGRRESDTTEHAHERLLYKGRPLSTWLRSIILCFNGPASVAWRLLMSGISYWNILHFAHRLARCKSLLGPWLV